MYLLKSIILTYTVGPKLPYRLEYSAMVVTKASARIFMIGGGSVQPGQLGKTLNSLLELVNGMSEWKEVSFPLENFRKHHLALQVLSGSIKGLFCGKILILYSMKSQTNSLFFKKIRNHWMNCSFCISLETITIWLIFGMEPYMT